MQTPKSYLKRLMDLSIPIVFGQLGLIMMGVFDSIMVGRLGPVELAAAGIANSVFFLTVVFGFGVMMSVSTLVSIFLGEKRERHLSFLFKDTLIIALGLSVVLYAVLWLLISNFHWFDQPIEVQEQAIKYLKIVSYSILPMYLYMGSKGVTDGYTKTRVAMVITFCGLAINVFVNWLLIYGNWGFPQWELVGAAYATLISRWVMALALLIYLYRKDSFAIYFKDLLKIKRKKGAFYFKELFQLGIPTGFQSLFEIAAFSTAAIMAGWIGTNALAAHQAAINLASVTYMMAMGLSAGASIMVANGFGKEDHYHILKSGKTALLTVALTMGVFAMVFYFFRTQLMFLYTGDPEVIMIGSLLLIYTAVFQLSDGVQAVSLGILRGIKDVNIPLFITFMAYWVLALPLGYFLAFNYNLGISGIWIGLTLGLTFSAIALTWRFYKVEKRLFKQ